MKRQAAALLTFLLLAAAASSAAAGEGTVRGKITFRDKPLAGAVVRLFSSSEGGFQRAPDFSAPPTGEDGAFSVTVPDGSYFLIAVKTGRDDGLLDPGDLFAFYGGNPVKLTGEETINVGINCSAVIDAGARHIEGGTGIRGTVYLDGEPLPGARVTLYRDDGTIFRGIGFASSVTSPGGRFSFSLEPGEYWVVARKREGSERMGPLAAGDLFAFAQDNPVAVQEGVFTAVTLNAVAKLLKVKEEGQAVTLDGTVMAGGTTISGFVRDAAGQAVPGVYVTAYRDSMMIYKPDFISNVTGADGAYTLTLSGGGEYFIIARDTLGGPAEKGDLLGRYAGSEDHSVKIETGQSLPGIDLVVETVE